MIILLLNLEFGLQENNFLIENLSDCLFDQFESN